MQSQHIAMTIDEFHQLPWKLGFKHEYYDGCAHIRPGYGLAVATIPVSPCDINSPCPLRPARRDDSAGLVAAFARSFVDSPEYCDWPRKQLDASAEECVETFFAGERGRPLSASQVAEQGGRIVGAALVLEDMEGPLLDMLYVLPAWQRRGLATALVSAALNTLATDGYGTLASSYLLANEASVRWHSRFGFVEEPDLGVAKLRLQLARHEFQRQDALGLLSPEAREPLGRECRKWEDQVRALRAVQKLKGYEAVTPILRRGYVEK